MDIGDRIAHIREKKGYTLLKLSKKLNASQQTISRYENDQREIKLRFLKDFGKLFKLSGSWLLYGIPPIYQDTKAPKSAANLFLELSALLDDTTIDLKPGAGLDDLTRNTTDNYLTLLKDMNANAAVREKVLQFYHLFIKTQS